MNLDHPLGERAKLHVDANATQGNSAFRYAPSVDVFSFTPSDSLLAEINESADGADPAFEAEKRDYFAIGHRFIGHGNRDWRLDKEEYDFSAGVEGQIREGPSATTRRSASSSSTGRCRETPSVHAGIIREEILAGRYNLANPLSRDPDHVKAIEKSSLREELDFGSRYLDARFALEGTAPGMGRSRDGMDRGGVALFDLKAHHLLAFRGEDGPDPRCERGARNRAARATRESAMR